MGQENIESRHVLYRGHVQGVGFRYTARRIAQQFGVTGYVKNLSDGRVELVAEGPPKDLDGLLRQIADAMSGHIDEVHFSTRPASGEYKSFGVAF